MNLEKQNEEYFEIINDILSEKNVDLAWLFDFAGLGISADALANDKYTDDYPDELYRIWNKFMNDSTSKEEIEQEIVEAFKTEIEYYEEDGYFIKADVIDEMKKFLNIKNENPNWKKVGF